MHLLHRLPPLIAAVTLIFSATSSPVHGHPTIEPTDSAGDIHTQGPALLDNTAKPLPLLIWHGLGDKFDNPGLQDVSELVQSIHPGTHVHIIRLGDTGDDDRTATFFGNVSAQIAQVCDDLLHDSLLAPFRTPSPSSPHNHHHLHVNALGFSQGGQFLRGLLQRCPALRVHTLLTFGSQHNGIAAFQRCRSAWDLVCRASSALLAGNAWSPAVQPRVVPAQYYRPTTGNASADADYLAHSAFLADVNNERPAKNPAYAARVAALRRFVMVLFDEDTTVIPKESGWFAEVDLADPEHPVVTPLRERPLYKEDWLGLKALDERDGLVFRTVPGRHMEFRHGLLEETIREFLGPEGQAVQGLVEQVDGRGW